MNIVILEKDKQYLKKLKNALIEIIGDINFIDFQNPLELIEWLKNNNKEINIFFLDANDPIDIIKQINIYQPYALKTILGLNIDENEQKNLYNNGIDIFLDKNEKEYQLKATIKVLNKLQQLYKEEKDKNHQIEEIISYKEKHEKIALQKQIKIMKNDLSMFFEYNNLCEIYFEPNDILSGDGIFSKYINKNEYFIALIDAMGKGISASLTNTNSISFLRHSINKAVEYNDFSFERIIKDFINFVKTILLDNESLSIIFLYFKDDKIYYANFGMPPLYTKNEKILLNNQSIMQNTIDFKIDSIQIPDFLIAYSDGIIESLKKDKSTICYKVFKDKLKDIEFIKDIIETFNKECEQSDDITIFLFKKECKNYKKLFEIEFTFSNKNIDKVLEEIYAQDIPHNEKINFILQEILINTLEHNIINISEQKEELIKQEGYFLPTEIETDIKGNIAIYENNKFIKIVYKDETKGFDLSKLNSRLLKKYHGRGLKIIKKLSNAIFYNEKGNEIQIFIRKDNEI